MHHSYFILSQQLLLLDMSYNEWYTLIINDTAFVGGIFFFKQIT